MLRASGSMAQGRINVWRKWLVENEDIPVLDDFRWQRMHDAFIPDLRYQFGDHARVQALLDQFMQLRHDHVAKLERRGKAQVVVDTESQLITAVSMLPGNAADAQQALEVVEQTETNTECVVEVSIPRERPHASWRSHHKR